MKILATTLLALTGLLNASASASANANAATLATTETVAKPAIVSQTARMWRGFRTYIQARRFANYVRRMGGRVLNIYYDSYRCIWIVIYMTCIHSHRLGQSVPRALRYSTQRVENLVEHGGVLTNAAI